MFVSNISDITTPSLPPTPEENTAIATLHNTMRHYFARFRLKICFCSWPPKQICRQNPPKFIQQKPPTQAADRPGQVFKQERFISRFSRKEKVHKHNQFCPVSAWVRGGVSWLGGQGSNAYVRCADPTDHEHFGLGTWLGESVTRVTEKLSMCQLFMCLFWPIDSGLLGKKWQKFGNGPNTALESTVSNTELSGFLGQFWPSLSSGKRAQ